MWPTNLDTLIRYAKEEALDTWVTVEWQLEGGGSLKSQEKFQGSDWGAQTGSRPASPIEGSKASLMKDSWA